MAAAATDARWGGPRRAIVSGKLSDLGAGVGIAMTEGNGATGARVGVAAAVVGAGGRALTVAGVAAASGALGTRRIIEI